MPELPEVEVVCRNLSELLPIGSKISAWSFYRPDLRFKIPKKQLLLLQDQALVAIKRRAKYILFEFKNEFLISHLGMTGSWRREVGEWQKNKHDHLSFTLKNGHSFVYSDPRRFGFVEVVAKGQLVSRFAALGAEPLDKETDFELLTDKFKSLKAPIKTALMNQKLLVGVGNIYASEILFASQIRPSKLASQITRSQYLEIWKHTARILKEAIQLGGSTIDDYKNSYGKAGDFQQKFFVYGRELELCRICHSPIKQTVMAGRSTFWCSNCQK